MLLVFTQISVGLLCLKSMYLVLSAAVFLSRVANFDGYSVLKHHIHWGDLHKTHQTRGHTCCWCCSKILPDCDIPLYYNVACVLFVGNHSNLFYSLIPPFCLTIKYMCFSGSFQALWCQLTKKHLQTWFVALLLRHTDVIISWMKRSLLSPQSWVMTPMTDAKAEQCLERQPTPTSYCTYYNNEAPLNIWILCG